MNAMDRYLFDGRELGIVFAKDKRKTSDEMRAVTGGRDRDRDRDRDDRRDSRRDRRDSKPRERRESRDFDDK